MAEAKPSVAILGLEVISDAKGGIDADATRVAKELTDALRKRARVPDPKNKFKLAVNSDKDLLEMKLLTGCNTEGRRCMSAIGRELKADFLLYGKLERVQSQGVYKVTLKLLNVSQPKDLKTLPTAKIPFDEASGGSVGDWARRLYNQVTGVPNEGTLVVKVDNAKSGRVFVDGKPATGLSDGEATIRGLPEGNHEVAIEADGFERFAAEIAVVAGEETEMPITLPTEGSISGGGRIDKPGRPGGGWRTTFYISVTAFVAGTGGLVYSGQQVSAAEEEVEKFVAAVEAGGDPTQIGLLEGNACNDPENGGLDGAEGVGAFRDNCDKGNLFQTLSYASVGVMAGAGVLAVYSFYKGYMSAKEPADSRTSARRRSRDSGITITPIVSPEYAGGTVKIEF